jgi:mono/diheme cytochrome c family protein
MRIDMKRMLFDFTVWSLSLAAVSFVLACEARAGEEVFTATNPKWKAECGSCHVAYPPQLLPRASWRAIMAGLDKHFGTDASLDDKSIADIGAFLEGHAAGERGRAADKPMLRVTESRWFRHEHDEVPATTWKDKRVNGAANCAACHTKAESGDFSERTLRVPQ